MKDINYQKSKNRNPQCSLRNCHSKLEQVKRKILSLNKQMKLQVGKGSITKAKILRQKLAVNCWMSLGYWLWVWPGRSQERPGTAMPVEYKKQKIYLSLGKVDIFKANEWFYMWIGSSLQMSFHENLKPGLSTLKEFNWSGMQQHKKYDWRNIR